MTRISITIIDGVEVRSATEECKIMTRLTSLTLDENRMRPQSIARLATLIGLSRRLECLSLKSCAIDDNSFNMICDRMPLTKHLHKIDLTNNILTD